MSQAPDPPPMARSVNAPPAPPMPRTPTGRPLPIPAPGAPLDYSGTVPSAETFRIGPVLYTHHNALLPTVCVKCGGAQDVQMKTKKFTWAPSWIYITILVAWIVTLILLLVMQKKATITFGMCGNCRAKKMRVVWISLGLIGLFFILTFVAIIKEAPLLMIPAIICFFAGLIYLAVGLPVIRPRKIEANGRAEFTGCGPAFLDVLPQGV